jgi:predicted nucleic acid-binding protein
MGGDIAEKIIEQGGVVSVQVLNEFAAVARGRLRMPLPEIRQALAPIRALCRVEPIDEAIHERGIEISDRYGFSTYDSMVVRRR